VISKGLKAGIIFIAVLGAVLTCSTEKSTTPNPNMSPDTHLFLRLSDSLQYPGETVSMQILHWYGDDPDGEIDGFEWCWEDTANWTYTVDVMDTFFVPIRVAQDTFTFYIRAIDNKGLKDPTPDLMAFPIRNSPPEVNFPIDFVQRYSREVYTCFSQFTIGWSGSDLDGDITITQYEWYLADSSFFPDSADIDTMSWNYLDSLSTLKVFDDLTPGSYRFFLRCRDIAGAYSNIVFYPDTIDGVWNVKEPVGSALLVDDNIYFFTSDSVNFNQALTNTYGAGNYSTWDVTDRISYYPQDILATLNLFDIVIWNGSSYPHFRESQTALTEYLADGGHLLVSTTHAGQDTTIYPFLPVDSVITESISRVFTVTIVDDTSSYILTRPPGYPDTLQSPQPLSYSYGFRTGPPSGLIPEEFRDRYPAQALYVFDQDTVAARFPAYVDSLSNIQSAQIIYFSMYFFDCIVNDGFYDLMDIILTEEFQ